MKTSKTWAWLTRMSVIALLAAVLASTMALVAAPATPVAADSCWGIYQGSSSCYSSCWHQYVPGCPDYMSYHCWAINYDHLQFLGHHDYEKTWGGNVAVCEDWPNSPCPGFCN